MGKVSIFVEGKDDRNFIMQIVENIGQDEGKIKYFNVGGWTNLRLVKNELEDTIKQRGTNLVIFDANSNKKLRESELHKVEKKLNVEFELFLIPNNSSPGNLETLLLDIVIQKHQGILQCFDKFKDCINSLNMNYTLPIDKAKVFTYLESICSKTEFKKAKGDTRDYTVENHWDLNSIKLDPLKSFLKKHL